jgi:hypothetical protein
MELVISLILLAHGVGHALYAANSWGYWKADAGRAPLFENVLHASQSVEGIIGLLWLLPLAGFAAGAWAFYRHETWAPAALLASSIISAALILMWWGGLTPSTTVFALVVDVIVIAVLIWQVAHGLSLT